MRRKYFLLLLIAFFAFVQPVFTEAMYSPTWGLYIDLPEGYDLVDGDGKDRFSFKGPEGLMFDLVVYNNRYDSIFSLVEDVNRRINNQGNTDFFKYNGKQAAVLNLSFGEYIGWGLAVELESASAIKPMLIALSYCPADKSDFELFHISALDSIAPSSAERKYPGPITEYSVPRGRQLDVTLLNGIKTVIHENDAEAAQEVIEREYTIFLAYLNTPYLQQASVRFYRFIYRDSYSRVNNAATAIAQSFGGHLIKNDAEKRVFAQKVLSYIQNFEYVRHITESDFVNLTTAITENRGDCDSHSMLFAMILAKANIDSGIMISYYHGHAMGLADLQGEGARFESHGVKWLVAETIEPVNIGLIAQNHSDPQYWFGIFFE